MRQECCPLWEPRLLALTLRRPLLTLMLPTLTLTLTPTTTTGDWKMPLRRQNLNVRLR
jgi:hypothetical protein